MYKPLFRRIAEENHEIPDAWIYDELPQNVKIQIWREIIKLRDILPNDEFCSLMAFVKRYFCDEIGLKNIGSYYDSDAKSLEEFFCDGLYEVSNMQNSRYALSFIELICRLLKIRSDEITDTVVKNKILSMINVINYRLREAKIGWVFNIEVNLMLKVDNEATYQLTVEPMFRLLSDINFNETQKDFVKAYEAYQCGGYKDLETAVDYCVKSLESAIRNICVRKNYVFNKNATLHPLIQTLLKNKYLHNYHDDYLNSISKLLLEAGVIRNKITGHGKEEEKANDVRNDLNDNLVAFILAQTASCIVFLVKNLNY